MNSLMTFMQWIYCRLGEHSSKLGFVGVFSGVTTYVAATSPDIKAGAAYAIVMGVLTILVPNNKP